MLRFPPNPKPRAKKGTRFSLISARLCKSLSLSAMDISEDLRASHKQDLRNLFERKEWKDIYTRDQKHNASQASSPHYQHFSLLYFRGCCKVQEALCDTVTEFARSLDPKYLKEGEQVLVVFEGPFVSCHVTPRELLSSFIGSMVCVEGIVTKWNAFTTKSSWQQGIISR